MANLPYVLSYKNLPTLFEKINTAKISRNRFHAQILAHDDRSQKH